MEFLRELLIFTTDPTSLRVDATCKPLFNNDHLLNRIWEALQGVEHNFLCWIRCLHSAAPSLGRRRPRRCPRASCAGPQALHSPQCQSGRMQQRVQVHKLRLTGKPTIEERSGNMLTPITKRTMFPVFLTSY